MAAVHRFDPTANKPITWLGYDPQFWRQRARLCRQTAQTLRGRERELMLDIASCKDELARMAATALTDRILREQRSLCEMLKDEISDKTG